MTTIPRRRGPRPTGDAETRVLIPTSRALKALVTEAAREAGIPATEAWRRAARAWLLLDAAARRNAGSIMLADED